MSDSYNDHPDLRVVRLDTDLTIPLQVGDALSEIVQNNQQLELDFPGLRTRYAPDKVLGLLSDRQRSMQRSRGGYIMYVVYYGSRVIGVATAEQAKLRVRVPGKWFKKTIVSGPWLAYWLDGRRPAEQRYVGRAILQKIIADICKKSRMHGPAFTVVRLGNLPSIRMLEDTQNGFGGFVAQGEPREYPAGDGITTARQLYVARGEVLTISANRGR